MQRVLAFLLLSVFLVACGEKKKEAKSFEKALEASTGDSYSIAKLYTEKSNYTVFKNDRTGEFFAVNLKKWDRETMTSIDQFYANAVVGVDLVNNLAANREWVQSGYWNDVYIYDTNTVYDEWCDCYETVTDRIWVGREWIDTSSWDTFYYGGGFRFDNTSGQSRDLETLAALKEEAAEKFIAVKLSSEFSLSDNRAQELAKLANRYQKLENARELTSAEKDKFAMDALGVSMGQVERALKQKAEGNEVGYAQLLQTAARVNNTTPEQIGRFFTEVVAEEI